MRKGSQKARGSNASRKTAGGFTDHSDAMDDVLQISNGKDAYQCEEISEQNVEYVDFDQFDPMPIRPDGCSSRLPVKTHRRKRRDCEYES